MDNDTLRQIITDLYAHIITLYDVLDIKPDNQKVAENYDKVAPLVDEFFTEPDDEISLHTAD